MVTLEEDDKRETLRRNQPCPHLDLILLASRTVRKNTLEEIDNRITEAEEKISELEDKMVEITGKEQKKEKE